MYRKNNKIPNSISYDNLSDIYKRKMQKKKKLVNEIIAASCMEYTQSNIEIVTDFVDLLVKDEIYTPNYKEVALSKILHTKNYLEIEDYKNLLSKIKVEKGHLCMLDFIRFTVAQNNKYYKREINSSVTIEKENGKKINFSFNTLLLNIKKYGNIIGVELPQNIISLTNKKAKNLTRFEEKEILNFICSNEDFIRFCIKNVEDR